MGVNAYISEMQHALEAKNASAAELAAKKFSVAFHSDAFMIRGHEEVLLLAAKCFALCGDKLNAFEYIRLCEWNGYNHFLSIKTDESFAMYHNDKDFQEIFA